MAGKGTRPRHTAGVLRVGTDPHYYTSIVRRGGKVLMRTTKRWSKADALAHARRIARQLNARG